MISKLDISPNMFQVMRLILSRGSPYHGATGTEVSRRTRSLDACQRRGLIGSQRRGSTPFEPGAFELTEFGKSVLHLRDGKEKCK